MDGGYLTSCDFSACALNVCWEGVHYNNNSNHKYKDTKQKTNGKKQEEEALPLMVFLSLTVPLVNNTILIFFLSKHSIKERKWYRTKS